METCPKRMEYGPCGGVAADGTCEVAPHPCTFLDSPVRRWAGIDGTRIPARAGRTDAALATLALLDRGRVVVGDLPAVPLDEESLRRCARILRDGVDIALAGDAPDARVQFSPSLRAHLIQGEGLLAWAGVNARDRNRVAIEAELAGLAAVGVAGVNAVTGDHPAGGHRDDAMAVFDLDATEIAALARAAGHVVSVAGAPGRAPASSRIPLVLEKERAGADVCFIDHCGGAGPAREFVARLQDAGSALRFIACIPAVVSRESATLLASFPGIALPEGYIDGIAGAADPRRAGIDAAVALAETMLEIPGVVGVNLSGGPGPGGEEAFAEALAAMGVRLR